MTGPSVVRGSAGFRAAVATFEDDLRRRTGQPLYPPFVAHRAALASALDDLDLTAEEWQAMVWFLDWDGVDSLASVIAKARAAGDDKAHRAGAS